MRILSWMLVTSCLLTACGGGDLVLPDPGNAGPAGIRVVGGAGQSGLVRELLAAPFVVEVTDSGGLAVEGATVVFEPTSAGDGAEMLPATALTNAAGTAEARMLLGNKVGLQTGEARVVVDGATSPTTSFSAMATSANPGNRPPRADFNWHCESLSCQFTDGSTDSDGSVAAWSWDFGDQGTAEVSQPAHAYSAPGTYTVLLTVRDDQELSDETSAHVTVEGPPAPANKAPQADFDVHCSGLTCVFIDKSKDDDGSITGWLWNFGDGSNTSNERNPIHTYESSEHFDVLLTVTDNMGAADSKTHRADPKD
jgi:PKD repeat protein